MCLVYLFSFWSLWSWQSRRTLWMVLQFYFHVIKPSELKSSSHGRLKIMNTDFLACNLPLRRSHEMPDTYHISHREAAALFRICQSRTRGTMLSSVSFLRKDAWRRDSQWKKPISVHSKCRALMCHHLVGGSWRWWGGGPGASISLQKVDYKKSHESHMLRRVSTIALIKPEETAKHCAKFRTVYVV